MTKLSFIPPPPLQPPLLPHHPHHRLDAAPRVLQGPTYTINTRDRRIAHKVAKISVDQILDLIAGVYFNILCDLNLLKTLPSPPFFVSFVFFLALSCSNAPPNIEIRQSDEHFHALDIASLSFSSVHATAAIPTPPRPQRPVLPHHPHHHPDLAPRV